MHVEVAAPRTILSNCRHGSLILLPCLIFFRSLWLLILYLIILIRMNHLHMIDIKSFSHNNVIFLIVFMPRFNKVWDYFCADFVSNSDPYDFMLLTSLTYIFLLLKMSLLWLCLFNDYFFYKKKELI